MTGHPPGSDGFPGQPGEPPFPGRPGQPSPDQPPLHPYARQPYPQGSRPSRPRRWAPLLGGIGAAVLILVSAGVVVRSLSGADGPYASLPECGTLVSEEILGVVPAPANPEVSGEFVDAEDLHYPDEWDIEEMELLGLLQCKAIDRDYRELLWVTIYLHEAHGQDREAALELNRTLVGEMEERRQDWADGATRDASSYRSGRGWRETSTGDGGMVGVYKDESGDYGREVHAVLEFVTDNLAVWAIYSLYDSYEESDLLDYMELLSEQLYEQVTREAEPA